MWDIRIRNSPICACVTPLVKLLMDPDLRSPSPAQGAADALEVTMVMVPIVPRQNIYLCDLGQH